MSSIDPQTPPPEETPVTEENCLTEIHVAPDGRVYLFGASAAVLEMIWAAEFADDSLKVRLDRLRSAASRIVDSADESSFSACNQENLVNAPFTIPTIPRGTVPAARTPLQKSELRP